MIYVLVWFFLCVVAGWIASNKGRSGIGVFILAFFLSPLVGIIVALVMKSGDRLQLETAMAHGEYRKCPMCAEMIKSEALKCKHCGSEVAPYVRDNAPVMPPAKHSLSESLADFEPM